MTTGMRHTLPRQHHGGWGALPGVILSVLLLVAIGAGALYISTHKTSTPSTPAGVVGVPSDLVAVRDSLPRFQGMTDYQPAVYSGGTSMDAIYFSNENAQSVANFYQQQMLKDGWKQIDAPHALIVANPKTAPHASYEYKATKDSHTVTVTALETDANLTAGSTQTTVHIERNP